MRVRNALAVALAVVSLTGTPAPAETAVLPVGSGKWSSDNVEATSGCAKVTTGGTCIVSAHSELKNGQQGCVAATLAVLTDPNCHIDFSVTLTPTGTGTGTDGLLGEDLEYDIEVGACAGLTLSAATVQVHDPYMGDWVVHPRVVVTNTAWKIQGTLVSVSGPVTSVVILNVAATIKPGCTRARVRRGQTELKFHGVFSGTYQFL